MGSGGDLFVSKTNIYLYVILTINLWQRRYRSYNAPYFFFIANKQNFSIKANLTPTCTTMSISKPQ